MIETKNLTKTFDNFTAVDSLDLKIETGEFDGTDKRRILRSSWTEWCRKDYDDQSSFYASSSD